GNLSYSSPAVAYGMVFVGNGTTLYAFDASTGTRLWTFPTGDWIQSSPAVANGVVYVGSADDNLYALDTGTGGELWHYTTNGAVWSSPAVVNGAVYVGSVPGYSDGYFYAFRLG